MDTKTALRLTLQAATTAALLGAVAVPAITHDAPVGGFVGSRTAIDTGNADLAVNVPAWTKTTAKRFPACQDAATQPEGVIPANVVAVRLDGSTQIMDTGAAWDLIPEMGGKGAKGVLWIIGTCN